MMKDLKRNNDLILSLKLFCAFFIFAGYMLVFFILQILLLTPLLMFVLMNLLLLAVGVVFELLCLTEKLAFRITSDICSLLGLVCFLVLICCIFK